MMDQRDWGGCYDMIVDAPPPKATPAPVTAEAPESSDAPESSVTPSPVVADDGNDAQAPEITAKTLAAENIGKYEFTDAGNIDNAEPGEECCKLTAGDFTVSEWGSDPTRLRVEMEIKGSCFMTPFANYQIELRKDANGPVYRGEIPKFGTDAQKYSVVLASGTLQLTNVDFNAPEICDGEFQRLSEESNAPARSYLTLIAVLAILSLLM